MAECKQVCPDCGEPGEIRGHMGCQYPAATPDQGGWPEETPADELPGNDVMYGPPPDY